MKTLGPLAIAVAVLLVIASPAQTKQACGPSVCEEYWHAYRQEAIWPSQYVQQPRQSICTTFELMAHNGWRRQNLLGHHHFKPESTELSEAGKLKAQWILTQTPPSRRTIYVERGINEEQTSSRLAAVQQFTSGIGPTEGTSSVSDTNIVDYGRPASTVDAVFTGWNANQPAPVLPKAAAGSTGSN